MSDQTDRWSMDWAGPPARRPASFGRGTASRRLRLAAIPILPDEPELELEQLPPDVAPRQVATGAAFARLVNEGLPEADAAGLIGFAVGLAQGDSRWSLGQVNKLLFLRDMYSNTRWGQAERKPD
jgi:hypothetical protein